MKKVAKLSFDERHDLFLSTAVSMGMRPEVIEKDFWVCFLLNHLFNDSLYKDAFVFKGGTSLSKAYHAIERFSEDIDLILDWRKITNNKSDPWENRSRTKQNNYNKQLNTDAAKFYKDCLVPELNKELSTLLGKNEWVGVDAYDEMVVNFTYPKIFATDYITPFVRLEIGPLAEWMPSHVVRIESFAAHEHGEIFEQRHADVLTIDVERTFWEKITILHKLAHFPNGKPLPYRYARHLYDVYCLGNSEIKISAFKRKELLEKDIIFKQKFYYSRSSHYETATLKTIKLLPSEEIIQSLRNDYSSMTNMFYGSAPSFDVILKNLEELEKEIHNL